MKQNEYESIRGKLKKLLILAEQGERGERDNAQKLFENLCRQYGISIDELLDENQTKLYTFEIGRDKMYFNLFLQCYCRVLNENTMSYRKRAKNKVSVELTALQYAELLNFFNWHKINFNKELKKIRDNLFMAYCSKHQLFSDKGKNDYVECSLTQEELRRLSEIARLKDSLDDNQYHKLLEK